ncbi:hypothetical protein [Roseisolibacter sp. H3M3-2]|uniref:hypothetical protein n=1 Tax=Roseisolibacter sp. H3M3-2 TaxID=3031323 RepID=UPI0023DAE0C2|nr:hypothetical protein [Roseisolibacter sp. H3M3-2]MDF1503108.1 hypothetical protein [Roseisolibacter sp. H3M3-2]
MISTLISLIVFVAVLTASVGGYAAARRFVRERLRFVDAAQRASTPWLAGGGAWVLGSLVALLLPFVGPIAALSFGVSVGLGVAAGARDIRRGGNYLKA